MSNQDSAERVISFLTNPASYGSSASSVVHLETHASHLFLVGTEAYKLKKPLFLDFIDARAPLRRRQFCFDEIRLNQRTAPTLYEAVVGIARRSDGSLTLSPPHDSCIDFLVKMRRFDDNALLSSIIERGDDKKHMIESLALSIASMHKREAPNPEYPSTSILDKLLRENLQTLKKVPQLKKRAEMLLAQQLARYAALLPLLESRSTAFVKQLHGDLHTRNICLFEGSLVPFDGIEFNQDLTIIDTLLDVSFLVMDLLHLGAHRTLSPFLSTYLRGTGDYCGLPLLPLFVSYRATIRAKVLALEPSRWSERGEQYLRLAERMIKHQQPNLFVIGGLSGTGKSTIAERIGEISGGIVIRSDYLRKELFGGSITTPAPASAYDAQATEQVYRLMVTRAAAALASNLLVILDATFLSEHHQLLIQGLAETTGAGITRVWCHCSTKTALTRIGERVGDPSDATAGVRFQQEQGGCPCPENWLPLSTEGTIGEIEAELRQREVLPLMVAD